MGLGFLFAFIFILLTLASGFGVLYNKGMLTRRRSGVAVRRRPVVALLCGILCGISALSLCIVPASIHQIDAGQVAVVKVLGQPKGIHTAGTYFDFWLTTEYVVYDATVQTLSINTETYSSDAQGMDIAMIIQWSIDPQKAIEIATRYGNLETLGNKIESIATERTKSVLSAYSAMTIIEKRSSISPEVESTINAAIVDNYYVNAVTAVVTNITFSEAFEATVEAKMIAEQEVKTAEYNKQKALVEAEQELEVAKLQAQAKIAEAEAEAKSQLLVAEAQAMSTKLLSIEVARMLGFTITSTTGDDGEVTYYIDFTGKSEEEIKMIYAYVEYIQYLETWDGKLPTTYVVSGENGNGAVIYVPAA